MRVRTPCSTKGCKTVHTTLTTFRRGEKYTTPAEPCFACADKTARDIAAEDYVKRMKK